MRIDSPLNTSRVAIPARPVSASADTMGDTTAFDQVLRGTRNSDASHAVGVHAGTSAAMAELAELLLAQSLRQILPRGEAASAALATETWRGWLADYVARDLAPAIGLADRLSPTANPEVRA
ncbi:MAG: hypothetical protein NW216_11470 [Hyphomicrobium sp.]|nr:hypothetical protein [Hyphomicrobium sp.]